MPEAPERKRRGLVADLDPMENALVGAIGALEVGRIAGDVGVEPKVARRRGAEVDGAGQSLPLGFLAAPPQLRTDAEGRDEEERQGEQAPEQERLLVPEGRIVLAKPFEDGTERAEVGDDHPEKRRRPHEAHAEPRARYCAPGLIDQGIATSGTRGLVSLRRIRRHRASSSVRDDGHRTRLW